ncbi:hypothetical protein RchiOBHm_Chr6g0296941 [Rosa chinensis]|uniref:Uncharacterized protein n=1 Tax=Rosa chinensis TaxID=74649 RepID=A0A2P6PXK2_ROSCH|nr:hypothetical protein RchiOBHm_Chr6g0296941 [Rosa chinensis]
MPPHNNFLVVFMMWNFTIFRENSIVKRMKWLKLLPASAFQQARLTKSSQLRENRCHLWPRGVCRPMSLSLTCHLVIGDFT